MAFRGAFYYLAGLAFLTLAKTKHTIQGYRTPKPFAVSETDRAIAYDASIVADWLKHLQAYTGQQDLRGKSVLELGPGSDLGIGLMLIARGAARYSACDVNSLATKVPQAFYDALFAQLPQHTGSTDAAGLRKDLEALAAGRPERLNYVVRQDFDLVAAFGKETVDVVFSNAAFEHFDDIDRTVDLLTATCRPGAVIVAMIDLQTHSRWIREKDPNNIYRYADPIYHAFHFRGSPNRRRPREYAAAFKRNGWQDVTVTPLTTTTTHYPHTEPGVTRRFANAESQMEYLSIALCARKPG